MSLACQRHVELKPKSCRLCPFADDFAEKRTCYDELDVASSLDHERYQKFGV